ncbi:VRR-NUC domain-containing protein [Aegicerativicinus sediminis]|uniref:VRR-NUC domain-containing protein n=1 Tax=Aegicerativicinus sediminis TaxID=2893202 RepID=UPI001E3E003D|nr:VRR-NUC domain-containing protein [Aegicerativicinus sediminis]
MTEAQYQAKLIKQYEEQGWYVIKIISCNKNGLPDLLCLKPNETLFIEVKGPKGKLSKLQEYRINEIRTKGFRCEVAVAL